MCCRFFLEKSSPDLKKYVEMAEKSPLTSPMTIALSRPLITEGEIRPTDIVPVIATSKSGRGALFPMVWGFTIPRSRNPIINARIETAKEKDLFRDSWEHRRCVIPCSYYYEWEHLKDCFSNKTSMGDKYLIQPRNSRITLLAGLYRIEKGRGMDYPVFTVLTRESFPEIRFIHDRMPVILSESMIGDWINPENNEEDVVLEALVDMVFDKAC